MRKTSLIERVRRFGQAAIDSGKPLPGKEGLTTVEREK